jgi:putative endonuclease
LETCPTISSRDDNTHFCFAQGGNARAPSLSSWLTAPAHSPRCHLDRGRQPERRDPYWIGFTIMLYPLYNPNMKKSYYVYIVSSKSGTLYIGVTNDLKRRMYEHKHGLVEGFTKKYKVNRLVYYEETSEIDVAIAREKQLKRWRRSKKIDLIKSMNPGWEDLSEDWFD